VERGISAGHRVQGSVRLTVMVQKDLPALHDVGVFLPHGLVSLDDLLRSLELGHRFGLVRLVAGAAVKLLLWKLRDGRWRGKRPIAVLPWGVRPKVPVVVIGKCSRL
jgi:hypothetical protein